MNCLSVSLNGKGLTKKGDSLDYLYVSCQVGTGTNFISQTKSISIPKNHFHQFCFFLQIEMGMGQIYFLIKDLLICLKSVWIIWCQPKGYGSVLSLLGQFIFPTLCEPDHSIVLFSIFIFL